MKGKKIVPAYLVILVQLSIALLLLSPSVSFAQAIPNDLCTNAIGPLPVPSLTTGSTVGATIDSEAGFCGTSVTAPGVWYTVIGTGNTMTATTCIPPGSADYDTKISIYCSDCETLTCIGGNDDDSSESPFCGGTFRSTIDWCSQPGAEYRILVHGFGVSTGNFDLNLSIFDDGTPCSGAVNCLPEQSELINDDLTLEEVDTSLDRNAAPNAPAGVFTIEATFTNTSGSILTAFSFEVVSLTNGNVVLNADGGPAGQGATITVPPEALGTDGELMPNESFTVVFEIGLAVLAPFEFFVDAYGVVEQPI